MRKDSDEGLYRGGGTKLPRGRIYTDGGHQRERRRRHRDDDKFRQPLRSPHFSLGYATDPDASTREAPNYTKG